MSFSIEQIGGFTCRVRRPAPPGRATVLWVHGLGESGLGFEPLLNSQELRHYQHVAPDLTGYGRSFWRSGDAAFTLEQHADSLLDLVTDHLGTPVAVVGHSMGGVIGQLMCERASPVDGPQSGPVAAFVNVEGNLSIGDCGYSGKAAPQTLQQFLEGGMDGLLGEIYRLGIEDRAHRTYFASCCLCRPESFHLNSVELVALSKEEELAARFARLDMPKAFVHGLPSGAPPRSAELLREQQQDLVAFEPAGHWPFLDHHQAFAEWLAGFLDGVPLTGTG